MSGEGPKAVGRTERAVNVFSRGFDPLAALANPSAVPLPAPGARVYNNLGEWPLRGLGENPYFDVRKERETVMPKEQARREAIQKTIKEENARRKQMESKEAAYLSGGGLLGDIADATALLGAEGGGPLAAMALWRRAGSRVCVSIRSTGKGRDALRGRLTGTLLTYDRHFNLVLGDVEEVYRRRLPAGEVDVNQQSASASSWASRRLHQLFVRGDSVILVARVP